MRRSLVPPFMALGAVEGWLLLDSTSSGFELPTTAECVRQCGWSVLVSMLTSAAVGFAVSRGRRATVARFLAYPIAGPLVGAVALAALTSSVRPGDLPLVGLAGAVLALPSLPFFALPFAAWHAVRARPRSVLGCAEERGIWVWAFLAIALATSLTSHARGWLLDDMVLRLRPSHVGSDVERALQWIAVVGTAALTAFDVRGAVRVWKIDAGGASLRRGHAVQAIDLGVGDEERVEVEETRASYRDSGAGRGVIGDSAEAWRALSARVAVDILAVAVTVGALLAFKTVVDQPARR